MKRKLPANGGTRPDLVLLVDPTDVAVRTKFFGTRIKTKESRLLAYVPIDSDIGKFVLEIAQRPATVSKPVSSKAAGAKVSSLKFLNGGLGSKGQGKNKQAVGGQLVKHDKSVVPALLYSSGDLVIEQSQKKSSVQNDKAALLKVSGNFSLGNSSFYSRLLSSVVTDERVKIPKSDLAQIVSQSRNKKANTPQPSSSSSANNNTATSAVKEETKEGGNNKDKDSSVSEVVKVKEEQKRSGEKEKEKEKKKEKEPEFKPFKFDNKCLMGLERRTLFELGAAGLIFDSDGGGDWVVYEKAAVAESQDTELCGILRDKWEELQENDLEVNHCIARVRRAAGGKLEN